MPSLNFCFLVDEVPSANEIVYKASFRAWHTDGAQQVLLSVTKSEVRDFPSSSLFEQGFGDSILNMYQNLVSI